jgi:Rrf2 family protein
MLSFTKKTEYALIAVCHLAHAEGEIVSARDMARLYDVRLPLLMNVLKILNQGGVLNSVRGARGGYTLAQRPGEITLARLIEAVEGPPKLTKCAVPPDEGGENCTLMEICPVRFPLAKVHKHFRRFLAGVTVADIAFDDGFRGRKAAGAAKVVAQ